MRNLNRKERGSNLAVGEAGLLLVTLFFLALSSTANADETLAERVSKTSKGTGEARESREFDAVTTDSYSALAEETAEKGATRSTAKINRESAPQETVFGDYWVYSVDVELFNDEDRDGYFHGIDVLFDVDTIYGIADVYAVAYLSFEGGPWNEYAVSDDFTLFGSTSTDDYVLVTELLDGYPAGSYDLLIEIYEADTGIFVASAGPDETLELFDLPLEDANRDLPVTVIAPVAVTTGGGGSTGLPFLIALLGVLLLARQQASKE